MSSDVLGRPGTSWDVLGRPRTSSHILGRPRTSSNDLERPRTTNVLKCPPRAAGKPDNPGNPENPSKIGEQQNYPQKWTRGLLEYRRYRPSTSSWNAGPLGELGLLSATLAGGEPASLTPMQTIYKGFGPLGESSLRVHMLVTRSRSLSVSGGRCGIAVALRGRPLIQGPPHIEAHAVQ